MLFTGPRACDGRDASLFEAEPCKSPVWAVVACCALSYALPSTALASRPPHGNERKAITRAAIATGGGGGGRFLLVRVTGIRISTSGPWAKAIVTIFQRKFPRHPEMSSEENFYRYDGRWLDTNNASTPERNPPSPVQADLGLQPNSTKGGGGPSAAAIVRIVLGALFLVVRNYRKAAVHPLQVSKAWGGWWEPDPNNPGRQRWQICPSCRGSTYASVCGNCKGDGWIS